MNNLQIVYKSITDLKAAEYNPRKINDQQFQQLKKSLANFECVEPLVININPERCNILVGGHQRLKALISLGHKEVPCVEVNLTLEQEKELNVRLNKNTGEFDFELLTGNFEVADLIDWGFADQDFSFMEEATTTEGDVAGGKGSLADRFGIPPFSVLNARDGIWQERKKAWLKIGIKSELGRGDDTEGDGTTKGRTFGHGLTSSKYGKCLETGIGEKYGREEMTGTSIFDPVLCELAYRWFSPAGGTIIDPFAGGSVRGIVAAEVGRQYIGVDLRAEQVLANRLQGDSICNAELMPVWVEGDSTNIAKLLPDVKADMLFTCPPYADLEVYSDNPKDLSTMPYKEFMPAYANIIKNACSLLKENTFAVIVVGEVRDKKGNYYNFVGDTIAAFMAAGLKYYNEAILVTCAGSLPIRAGKQFASGRKLGKTHQNVLVFVKGDGKAATKLCGVVDFAEMKEEEGLV